MSLATRCPSCGTVFRVVQDQLKVSEGWVRCGRCNEVFNALEGLFDLDRDAPPEWSDSRQMLPVPTAMLSMATSIPQRELKTSDLDVTGGLPVGRGARRGPVGALRRGRGAV